MVVVATAGCYGDEAAVLSAVAILLGADHNSLSITGLPELRRDMPSIALKEWTNDRMPRLAQVEAQCAAALAFGPAEPESP